MKTFKYYRCFSLVIVLLFYSCTDYVEPNYNKSTPTFYSCIRGTYSSCNARLKINSEIYSLEIRDSTILTLNDLGFFILKINGYVPGLDTIINIHQEGTYNIEKSELIECNQKEWCTEYYTGTLRFNPKLQKSWVVNLTCSAIANTNISLGYQLFIPFDDKIQLNISEWYR